MGEYEYNWEMSMPEIKQCIEFFTTTTREMGMGGKRAGKAREKGEEKSKGPETK